MARRGRPVQKREIAAGVLEQRPLVDHRQLEMRVGVVDRLAAGLDEDHEHERQRAAPVRRRAPDVPAGRRDAHRQQVGAVRGKRRDAAARAPAAPPRTPRSSDRAPRPSERSRCRCPTPRRPARTGRAQAARRARARRCRVRSPPRVRRRGRSPAPRACTPRRAPARAGRSRPSPRGRRRSCSTGAATSCTAAAPTDLGGPAGVP